MFSSLRSLLSASVICLLLGWPLAAGAAVPSSLVKDFQPVDGHVVMPVDGQFLIDLDATQRIAVGDLFSVVQPGKQIVDPTSGKVLGTLDQVKGVLRVTKIRNGYSYASPLGSGKKIAAGDPIRRYEDMKATFWDYTGNGEPLFSQLRQKLPHLDWESYAAAQKSRPQKASPPAEGKAQVLFILTSGSLQVRDSDFHLLHDYPLGRPQTASGAPEVASQQSTVQSSVAVGETNSTPAAAIVTPPKPTPIVKPVKSADSEKKAETAPSAGIWKGPSMKGQPVGMAVGDFDGDGRREVAVAFSDRLVVARIVDGQSSTVAKIPLDDAKVLGLDDFDLNGDGRPELYVTAVWNKHLSSQVVTYRSSGYRVVQTGIPWYFRRVDLPRQGPTLLGQKMGGFQEDFAGPIFRVGLVGGKVTAGSAVSLPSRLTLYGFVPLPQKNGPAVYVTLTGGDHLQVLSADGESLWQSGEVYGGTETSFERPDSTAQGSESGTRSVYLKARLAQGPNGEVLASANEGTRILSRIRRFSRSRLVALKWDGSSLQEVWHTWPQKGYLADFCVADADNDGHPEVAMVVGFNTSGLLGNLFSSSRSAIYLYDLP